MKVYIDGRDNVGWSIDSDHKQLSAAFERLGIIDCKSAWSADIVHNLWWDEALSWRRPAIRFHPRLLVSASNFINLDDPNYVLREKFERIRRVAYAWLAPSSKQKRILDKAGLRTYLFPFPIDLAIFRADAREVFKREDVLASYRIDPEKYVGKVLIGSFQRDSLGSDLSKPKWQKDPEFLIDVVKDLPHERYVLLLAGPRRHFIRERCRKLGIPFVFAGKEQVGDDLSENTLTIDKMPALYSACDVYIVSSKSEGGPKAVMEAASTKTLVLSTDVGLAADFLEPKQIISEPSKMSQAIRSIIVERKNQSSWNDCIEKSQARTREILKASAIDARLMAIYKDILSANDP